MRKKILKQVDLKGNCKLCYLLGTILRSWMRQSIITIKLKASQITVAHKTKSRTSHKKAEQIPANNNHKVAAEELKRKLNIFQEAVGTEDACPFTKR